MRYGTTSILLVTCILIAGCTHIRIHDLDSDKPEETVGLKNRDVQGWLAHYANTEVEPIKFCSADAQGAGSICDETTPSASGRVVFSFIHLSDVQLYDERVVIVSRAVARLFDNFVGSARLDPLQAKHDTAVYLSMIRALSGWNESLCMQAGAATAYNPMFVVHTGDEIHADVYQEMWEFINVTSTLTLPWFPIIGNHDVMTFGTRPAAKDTVTKIETDRPSLAMNLIRTPQEFMAFHSTGSKAKLPPGLEIPLPPYHPMNSGCGFGTRSPAAPPVSGNPFDGFEITSTRGAADANSACVAWESQEASLRERGERPGYYAWTSDSRGSRIPEAWQEQTLAKDIRLRFLFLNTAQDITFSSGGIREDQLAWVSCQLEQAAQQGEYVIAFGHHPLSTLFSEKEGVGFRDSRYSEIAQRLIDRFAANDRFLGYFTGHTHRYEHHRVCATGGRCFNEVQAPSAVQQVPQAGLLVRVVEPLPTRGDNVALEVHPFIGPYVEAGYRRLDCDVKTPELGAELPALSEAAALGSTGALRHEACRFSGIDYESELRKLRPLVLETNVISPLTR